jgi:hypothetical protein
VKNNKYYQALLWGVERELDSAKNLIQLAYYSEGDLREGHIAVAKQLIRKALENLEGEP